MVHPLDALIDRQLGWQRNRNDQRCQLSSIENRYLGHVHVVPFLRTMVVVSRFDLVLVSH